VLQVASDTAGVLTILALAGSLSKNSRGSDYIAGLVKLVISLPQSRDYTITPAFGQAALRAGLAR
jgi:hypothetical protein